MDPKRNYKALFVLFSMTGVLSAFLPVHLLVSYIGEIYDKDPIVALIKNLGYITSFCLWIPTVITSFTLAFFFHDLYSSSKHIQRFNLTNITRYFAAPSIVVIISIRFNPFASFFDLLLILLLFACFLVSLFLFKRFHQMDSSNSQVIKSRWYTLFAMIVSFVLFIAVMAVSLFSDATRV